MNLGTETPTTDSLLTGLTCPRCSAALLHSPTNGYSACWCGRCGSPIALSSRVAANGALLVTVVGLRNQTPDARAC